MPTVNYADAYQKSIEEAYYPTALYSADLWNSPSNGLYTFDRKEKLPAADIQEIIDEARKIYFEKSAAARSVEEL